MYDYLIKNGLVVDGSGKPAVKADVAVKGDKVARIAPDIQEPAAEVYDAAGKYVIPGLIDPHVHEEWYCFDDGRYESYIRQGVTTLVNAVLSTVCVFLIWTALYPVLSRGNMLIWQKKD